MLLISLNLLLFLIVFSRNRLNRIDIVILTYYIVVLIGIPGSIFSTFNNSWWLRDVSDGSIQLAYNLFHLMTLCFGLFCLSCRTPSIRRPINGHGAQAALVPMNILLMTSLVTSSAFVFPNSALAGLLFQQDISALQLAELRATATLGNETPKPLIYYNNLVVRYLVPFALIYVTLFYFVTNKRRWNFYFAFFVCIFCSSMSLAKGPIISILLFVLLCRIATGRLVAKDFYYTGAVGIFAIAFLYTSVMATPFNQLLPTIADRVFVVQYVGVPITIEVFADAESRLPLGSSIGTLADFLGIDFSFFSRETMAFANPFGFQNGTAGFLSTFAPAEGYAVGGTLGFAIVGFLSVLFFRLIDLNIGNRTSMIWRAFYIFCLMKFPFLFTDSATAVFASFGMLATLVFVVSVSGFSGRRVGMI